MSIHHTNSQGFEARPGNDLTMAGEHEAMLRTNALDSLDGMFAMKGEDLSKPGLESWRQRIRLTLSIDGANSVFYLKRFTCPPVGARRDVRRSGTGARSVAGMEWSWMQSLAVDGIPSIKPVAFGEELVRGRELRSAILTAAVPGRSLERLCKEWCPEDRRAYALLVVPLAELVGRLHRLGYIHRDLYLSHIYYDADAPIEQALHLIDLQRVMRSPLRHNRWVIKDLAALNHSVPHELIRNVDRLRWLKHYLRVSGLNMPLRSLVYRIVGKTLRIDRHEKRRQARLAKPGDRA